MFPAGFGLLIRVAYKGRKLGEFAREAKKLGYQSTSRRKEGTKPQHWKTLPNNEKEFTLHLRFEGAQAYVLDFLLQQGYYGCNRDEVTHRILCNWMIDETINLSKMKLGVREAKKEGYIALEGRV